MRNLVKDDVLIKIGRGVFGKAKKSPIFNKPVLVKNISEVAKEALAKLK